MSQRHSNQLRRGCPLRSCGAPVSALVSSAAPGEPKSQTSTGNAALFCAAGAASPFTSVGEAAFRLMQCCAARRLRNVARENGGGAPSRATAAYEPREEDSS